MENVSELGKSVQGQPITALKVGEGLNIIVITAAIHGSEKNTVSLVENLTAYFSRSIDIPPHSTVVYFIKCLSPDGFTLESRYNANGVDLNRNWNTSNWQADTMGPSGVVVGAGGIHPFSEPETITFSSWLLSLQKEYGSSLLVINYHSMSPPRGLVQPGYRITDQVQAPDSKSEQLARIYAAAIGARYENNWIGGYLITGELIHWCADNGIVSFDVELPHRNELDSEQIRNHIFGIEKIIRSNSAK